MLAPMTFASALGLGGIALPICAGMSLSLGGNAITVSDALHRRRSRAPDPTALRALIEADRDAGCRRCASGSCSRTRCTISSCATGSPPPESTPNATSSCASCRRR
jgi:hypothetical protein